MSEQEPVDESEATASVAETIDEHPEALAESLETLVRLQETGTLDDLAAAADTVSLMTAAMDDEMVMTLASTGSRLGEVVDTAADEDVVRGLEQTLSAVGDASGEQPRQVGMLGLLGAMRDPEVKAGMGYLIQVAKALGRRRAAAAEDGQ